VAISGVAGTGLAQTDIFCDYEEGQFKNILLDGAYSVGRNACLSLTIKDLSPEEIVLQDADFKNYSVLLALTAGQRQEMKDWESLMACRYYFRITEFEKKTIKGSLIKILECN
jgi:hypothetical protein